MGRKKVHNELRDKCGIIGVYSFDENVDVASWIYSGLYALQHRGQESAGISVLRDDRINTHVGMGLLSEVFNKDLLDILNGNVGIGHVRYSTTGSSQIENCQPFVKQVDELIITVAHNGDIINSELLRQELIDSGHKFKSTTDSEVISNLIIDEYKKTNNIIESIKMACSKLIGSYSLVLVINGVLYAIRDPLAMKPLALGGDDEFIVVASESVAFDAMAVSSPEHTQV